MGEADSGGATSRFDLRAIAATLPAAADTCSSTTT
jgi:hypothetical protein